MKVTALVVTRNRRDLLRQSLAAVRGQTRPPDNVIVVDNASTDGTPEMLAGEFGDVAVLELPTNQGGAGGFHEAMRAGYATGADWLWLLDDDSFPRRNALTELLTALERLEGKEPPALLASRVEWTDGQPHPMNRPTVQRRDPDLLARAAGMGLLPLRAATFVSLLVSREAVERNGFPLRQFFWQTDDIEYTARVLRSSRGYFVPDSVVEHRTPTKHTAADDPRRFYFAVRNTVFMLRGHAWAPREKPGLAWALGRLVAEHMRANRMSAASLRALAVAIRDGLRSPAG